MLTGKCAIIYGGSGAIGSAVARVFAREGASVNLVARSRDRLEATARSVREGGGSADIASIDVFDAEALAQHAADVAHREGGIDVMLNATSFLHDQGTEIDELDVETFMKPVDAFLRAGFNATKAVLPHMNAGGAILSLSTPAAKMTIPGHLGYAATCAAVESFSRCLAQEVGGRGIRAVCLRPHAIADAPEHGSYTAGLFAPKAKAMGLTVEEWLSAGAQGTMLHRLPTLQDVAETAAFLASDRARAITGTVANLTCGQLAD